MKPVIFGIVILGLMLAFAGCGKESPATTSVQAQPLPADLIVAAAPAGAIDIAEAKKSAKDGEPIVVRGHVGGAKEPLAPSRAIMTIADNGLRTCDKSPMKDCVTPWDSCCEPSDVISANTLSVQASSADGSPLKSGLAAAGIAPLTQVIVAGTARTAGGALLIDAKHIYLAPPVK